ncbi:hypothetical protein ACLK19_16940 [Escherichia coli]
MSNSAVTSSRFSAFSNYFPDAPVVSPARLRLTYQANPVEKADVHPAAQAGKHYQQNARPAHNRVVIPRMDR